MVEQKVAETILQDDQTILIDGVSYKVAPPTTGTLIMASAELAKAPEVTKSRKNEDILRWSLSNAKDCGFLGDVVAILILGSKRLKKEEKRVSKKFFGLIKKEEVIDIKKELSDKLLDDLTNNQLYDLAITLLERMEVGSFFGLTTFLVEINLLRPKVGATQTPQFGQ